MNLGDPELELIDPTPNIHNLFIQFDKIFFCAKLASRAVVRWSKKMYSCAGVCSYEGIGGLCDIALSEPLLKLRPRKNLVETLLHEMIHAYLFITCRDNDRDGHGPNFQAHMHRINKSAGINITIYHDFHDEVKLYQNHVWRCNGPCQQRRPYFGIVRKTANRPPGPKDYWWENHRRYCGGTFIKIKEPEKSAPKTTKKIPPKPKADITKYINTDKTVPQNVPAKPVLKDSNHIPVKTKSNGGNTVVITKKGPTFNPQVVTNNNKSPVLFSGKGQTLADTRPRSNSVGVVETVRNIWANKQLPFNPTAPSKQVPKPNGLLNNTISSTNKIPKHKIESHTDSPPAKVMKIDDYFKTTASSVLKDLYGKDFQITQNNKDQKLIAVADIKTQPIRKSAGPEMIKSDIIQSTNKPLESKPMTSKIVATYTNMVDCPVCNAKVSSDDINRHLDECLNQEVIETLSKDNKVAIKPSQPSTSSQNSSKKELKEMVGALPTIPEFKPRPEVADNITNEIILANKKCVVHPPISDYKSMTKLEEELNTAVIDLENDILRESEVNKIRSDPNNLNKLRAIIGKTDIKKLLQESEKRQMLEDKIRQERENELNIAVMDLENDILRESDDIPSFDPNDVNKVKAITKKINFDKIVQESDKEKLQTDEKPNEVDFGYLPSFLDEVAVKIETPKIKIEPGSSKGLVDQVGRKCACCGKLMDKPIDEHLDECLAFFENNNTIPNEGASTSFANETIVIDDDDDDIFDESQIYNATGTKTPCPCCLTMVEERDMKNHLDMCLDF